MSALASPSGRPIIPCMLQDPFDIFFFSIALDGFLLFFLRHISFYEVISPRKTLSFRYLRIFQKLFNFKTNS